MKFSALQIIMAKSVVEISPSRITLDGIALQKVEIFTHDLSILMQILDDQPVSVNDLVDGNFVFHQNTSNIIHFDF